MCSIRKVPTGYSYLTDEPHSERISLKRYAHIPCFDERGNKKMASSFHIPNYCFFRRVFYNPHEVVPFLKSMISSILDEAGELALLLAENEVKEATSFILSLQLEPSTDPEELELEKAQIQFSFITLYSFCGVMRDSLHGKIDEAFEFLSVPYLRHCLIILLSNRSVLYSREDMMKVWIAFVFRPIVSEDYPFMFELARASIKNTNFNEISTPSPISFSEKSIAPRSVSEWDSFSFCEVSTGFHSPDLQLRKNIENEVNRRISLGRGNPPEMNDFTALYTPKLRSSAVTIERINATIFPDLVSKSQKKRKKKQKPTQENWRLSAPLKVVNKRGKKKEEDKEKAINDPESVDFVPDLTLEEIFGDLMEAVRDEGDEDEEE